MGRERRGRSAGAQSCSSAAGAQAPARSERSAGNGGQDRERRHGPARRRERAQRRRETARQRGQQPQRQPEHGEQRDQQIAHGPGALARGVREQNRVQPRAAAEAVGRERDRRKHIIEVPPWPSRWRQNTDADIKKPSRSRR